MTLYGIKPRSNFRNECTRGQLGAKGLLSLSTTYQIRPPQRRRPLAGCSTGPCRPHCFPKLFPSWGLWHPYLPLFCPPFPRFWTRHDLFSSRGFVLGADAAPRRSTQGTWGLAASCTSGLSGACSSPRCAYGGIATCASLRSGHSPSRTPRSRT